MSEHPFQRFISLVEFDQETRKLHAQIAELQKTVKALDAQEAQLQDALQKGKDNIKELHKAIDAIELEMQSLDDQQKRKRKKLDESAGNYKEYQALKREVEQLNERQLAAEESLIDLWNKRESAEKEFDEKSKAIEKQLEETAAQRKENQDKITEIESQLSAKTDKRSALVQAVPEEWLEKYEMMSMRVPDPVVPVLNGSCSACFYAIVGPDLARLKHRAIVQCKGCFRLLFMKEAMDEATTE